MRTIKSVWTRPPGFFREGIEVCASLSVVSALNSAGNCTVYADKLGADWVRALQLPLPPRDIVVALDDCPGNGHAWSEGKLFTYVINAKKRTGFLHTDLDVFIWRDWADRIKRAKLVAERPYWRLQSWAAGLELREEWLDAVARQDGISFACGTYGGTDWKGIARIAEAGLEFLSKNRRDLSAHPMLDVCLMAEEWAIAREYDWNEVSTILPGLPFGGQFATASGSYHHALASKHTPEGIAKLEARLEQLLPGQVRRCREVRKAFQNQT